MEPAWGPWAAGVRRPVSEMLAVARDRGERLARLRIGRRLAVATGLCLVAGMAAFQGLSGGSGDGPPTHVRTTGQAQGGDPVPGAPMSSAVPGPDVVALEDVDWDAVEYPLDCRDAGPPHYVVEVTYGQTPTGIPLAIARVACAVGAGTPPMGLYVFDGATAAGPHFAQTLLSGPENWFIESVSTQGPSVSAAVLGWSSPDLCRACADVGATLTWNWRDHGFWSAAPHPEHWAYRPPSSEDTETIPIQQLNDLIAQHSEVFVGLYSVGDHRERFLVVVVEKGVDPGAWEALLREAGSPMRVRPEESWTTVEELQRARSELGAWMESNWSKDPGRSFMAVGIFPSTSTVRVTGFLTEAERAELRTRYGGLVSFEEREMGHGGWIGPP